MARPEGEGDIDWQAISADGRVTRGTAKRDADSIAISFVLRMPGASPAVAKPAAPQGELAPNPFD